MRKHPCLKESLHQTFQRICHRPPYEFFLSAWLILLKSHWWSFLAFISQLNGLSGASSQGCAQKYKSLHLRLSDCHAYSYESKRAACSAFDSYHSRPTSSELLFMRCLDLPISNPQSLLHHRWLLPFQNHASPSLSATSRIIYFCSFQATLKPAFL